MFERILKWLDDYFSRDEREEIEDLKYRLRKCEKEKGEILEEFGRIKMEIKLKEERIRFLETIIYGEKVEPPEWLDTSKKSYQPLREIQKRGNKTEFVKIKPCDLYVPCPTLVDLVYRNKWHKLKHGEKLIRIWHFVIRWLTYQFDKVEDWRHPIITYNYRKGDCEDGTILFVTLCRIAGVPANKVFNACGWFYADNGKFGHSFPIAQMSDGRWYVFETTLDTILPRPVLFEGSRYDASWGVHNWMFDGKIKEKYRQKDGKYQV